MITTVNSLGRNTALLHVNNEQGEEVSVVLLWDEMKARWTVRTQLRDTKTGSTLTEIKNTIHERKIKGKAALRAQ